LCEEIQADKSGSWQWVVAQAAEGDVAAELGSFDVDIVVAVALKLSGIDVVVR
jgi:Trk K+ transport system NAD-binding subunit